MKEVRHIDRLRVEFDLEGRRRAVGTLVWSGKDRVAFFQYDSAFVSSPLPISPIKLPVDLRVHRGSSRTFEGLHGLFNDSLPDGWGRRLFDRRLKSIGYDDRLVTPLDRLAFIGGSGMGALRFIPERSFDAGSDDAVDLDWLSHEARRFEQDELTVDIVKLQEAQGGSAGARPKIVVGWNPTTGRMLLDRGQPMPKGFEHWLVKFRAHDDPKEIGAEEYAYALMARAAGVVIPDVTLLRTDSDAYFAVERFDRSEKGRRHVHSVSGLLHVDHRDAGAIDYDHLLKLTMKLTRNAAHTEQMFARMVFNVLAHNRDDHAKNHAFIMAPDGVWSPSPAYDITFSRGPGGEHNLAVAGEGRRPELKHILEVAAAASLSETRARAIHEQALAAVRDWPLFADRAGLSAFRTEEINAVINGRGLHQGHGKRGM